MGVQLGRHLRVCLLKMGGVFGCCCWGHMFMVSSLIRMQCSVELANVFWWQNFVGVF